MGTQTRHQTINLAINGFGRITNLLSKLSGKFDYDGIDQGLVDGLGRISGVAGGM